MRVKLMRTRDWRAPADEVCAVCGERFYLGEVSAVAVSNAGGKLGEVCLACVHAGADHLQAWLDKRARISRAIADEDEQLAAEGVEDLPSVDEILAFEGFYARGID